MIYSAYSKAVSLGFPFIVGDGKPDPTGTFWMNKFSKTKERKPPFLYLGYDPERRVYVVEESMAD